MNIKQQQTICYKVDQCVRALERTLETGDLDIGRVSDLLHQIRKDAQKMENGLLKRKKVMQEAGIEEKYQEEKGDIRPTGINNIPNEAYAVHNKPEYEITVKNGEEIVYQNKVVSGVMCTVEDLQDMDKDGHIRGTTQTFVFGNTVGWWYAFDQLRQSIEDKRVQIGAALKEMAKNNQLLDPEVRKKLLGL